MLPSEIREQPKARLLRVQRSNLVINVNFGSYFWSLVHDIPRFYDALLTHLAEFGVSPTSIRAETGDNLGAYNVNFYLLNYKANVKIRLERMEFGFTDLTAGDIEQAERAFGSLLAALAASTNVFKVSGYQFDMGLHGFVDGATSREIIGRFIANTPTNIGRAFGGGVVFYFGKDAVEQTITLDLSAAIPDALFIRTIINFEGAPPADFAKTIQHRVQASLASLGLRSE